MTLNKRKKSVAKILSSMILTLLQKKKESLLNVYRNFGLKTPGCYGYVYHTQFSVAYFLVSALLSKMFDVGNRDLTVLTSGNWVIKGCMTKWPVKLRTYVLFFTFFNVFFSKSKKTWLFTFLPCDASAERGNATVSRLSVRLSVTIRCRVQIGWNSSKITSRPNSLRPLLWLTPTWAIWCNGNTPKIRVEQGWGQEHIKPVRCPKRCEIGQTKCIS